MGILGKIESKQKRFSVGGREVFCVDADFPGGKSPAAKHFMNLVLALCDYAEREQFPAAADALMRAVEMGQGHRFAKRLYRITLSEARAGIRQHVTLEVSLSCFNAGEQIDQFHRLETLWDAQGILQVGEKREKRRIFMKNRKGTAAKST